MSDQGPREPPRIALVFGDEEAAVHVRDAIGEHVDIVYSAPARNFDAAQLAGVGATAALVNLDGGDWPDPAEAIWNEAGVPVVFNDAEVSRSLEGWSRARWSRHLVAKLSGSGDFDPPRPAVPGPDATAVGDPGAAHAPQAPVASNHGPLVERPLSAAEIETMTADFVAGQMAAASAAASISPDLPATDPVEPDAAQASARDEPAEALPVSGTSPEDSLDVDTEALSAMIDARLAEPESPASDSSEVWRIATDADTAPAPPVASGEDGDSASPVAEPVAVPATAPADEVDVFASLPSLDDWQLVDPNAPAHQPGKTGHTAAEPAMPEGLEGLELLPMDQPTTVATTHSDPIERWLDDSAPASSPPRDGDGRRSGSGGGAR